MNDHDGSLGSDAEYASPIQAQLAAPPAESHLMDADTPPAARSILHSKAAVLATLFLVTGALGIPLLWINPRFSRIERIVWTIIVTVYTIALIAIAYAIVMWSYRQIIGRL